MQTDGFIDKVKAIVQIGLKLSNFFRLVQNYNEILFLAPKHSGRFLKFLKMIEIPWLMQDNDLPFSDITELSDYGISYQLKAHDCY